MKPPPFEYASPTSLTEAVALLAACEGARPLAGGQSLMPMLNMRIATPERLVDLNRIPELAGVRIDGDDVVIGAMTRQRQLEKDAEVARLLPLIPLALRHVGHFQTRNRGTIGGSLCHLDPSAELPAIARAYDATIEVAGPAGPRRIAMADWPASYMETALAQGEVLTGVRFAPWRGHFGVGFQEFSRRHGDFAVAGAAVLLAFAAGGAIERASVTLFGVDAAPVRARACESALVGERPGDALFARAAARCRGLATLRDPFYSPDYRDEVAIVMAERALAQAAGARSLDTP